MTQVQLGTPLVWCWDNLNVHLVKELADFAEGHNDWLRILQMPSTPFSGGDLVAALAALGRLRREDLDHLTRERAGPLGATLPA